MSFSSEKPLFATLEREIVTVWDLEQNKKCQQWAIKDRSDPSEPGTLLQFDKQARYLATLCGAKVRFWDVKSGKLLYEQTLRPHYLMTNNKDDSALSAICIDSEFTQIYYTDEFSGGSINVQNFLGFKDLRELPRQLDRDFRGGKIQNLKLTANGRILVGIGLNRFYFWDVSALMLNKPTEDGPFLENEPYALSV